MTIIELEKDFKSGKLSGIYLLYGEEEYLIESSIKKIKKLFGEIVEGINYIQLDANNIEQLIPNIETVAFGYSKKMILIKNSNLFKKDEATISKQICEYIGENLQFINENIVLIFSEKEATDNNLTKLIKDVGTVCNFAKLKPIQLSKKVKEICNMYKVNIQENTIQEFIEICGTDMQNLINEIRKLIECVGKNGTITSKEIKELSVKKIDTIIFDLTDSLGRKDIENALQILHDLVYNKEPIQRILITLYGHFKRLYLMRLAEQYNYDQFDVLNLKHNQTFLITKYRNQIKYFKTNELRKIISELIELDYKCKQGLLEINVGLDAILCAYCG